MKVLHFVSIMNRAGQETLIMNIYRNIDRSKVQFGFLCSVNQKGDYDDEIYQLGGKIYYIDYENNSGKLRHLENYKTMCREFKKYAKEYDVIHIHNYHAFDTLLAAKAALKSGVKRVVVHSHNSSADVHLWLHKLCRPILSHLPVTKLACSKLAGEWMFSTNDFQVIPNGIIVDQFLFNDQIREQYRQDMNLEGKYVIGHAGRFVDQKNHTFIIDVFSQIQKKHDDMVLVLVGDGALRQTIEEKVKQLKIEDKVLFLGVRNDIANLYQCFDLFFFPSLFEGLGIVAVEAETADIPCLFSDGLPKDIDIIKDIRRCSLNAPIDEWEKAIESFYVENQTRRRVDVSDIIKEAGFDVKDTARKMQRIYMRCMSHRRKRRK